MARARARNKGGRSMSSRASKYLGGLAPIYDSIRRNEEAKAKGRTQPKPTKPSAKLKISGREEPASRTRTPSRTRTSTRTRTSSGPRRIGKSGDPMHTIKTSGEARARKAAPRAGTPSRTGAPPRAETSKSKKGKARVYRDAKDHRITYSKPRTKGGK